MPVHTVDTRQVGIAAGFAVLAAADVLDAGGSAAEAAEAARARANATTSLFYVDTLEYLRRGGRIGAAAALLGGALAVKPLLTIAQGRVATLEKVRDEYDSNPGSTEFMLRKAVERHYDIEMVEVITAQDIDITKEGSEFTMRASYEDTVPLAANVSFLVEFDKSVVVNAR